VTKVGESVLHCGDCLEVLPTLEGIDAVFCDPPYGIDHSSNFGASWERTTIAGDDDTATRDFIVTWARSRNLPWLAFGSWKRQPPTGTRATLVWDKGPAFGMGDLSLPWKPSWEEIYVGGDGWEGTRDEGVIRGHIVVSWESRGRKHPHQKPVSLMAYLLSKLPGAATILDPTMGTGSTGVACTQMGRRFIGIESDPKHYATAVKRIKEAECVGTLFDTTADAPTLFAR
jgi:DNA modification methylase